ncbi:L-selectin-like [Glandiceps talaboti]
MLFGGSLAIVDNERTSNALFNFIDLYELYDEWCLKQKKGFWIELKDYGPYEDKDEPKQHNFLWCNGYCVGDFENWAAGEPNDNRRKNENGQNCVQLWYRSTNPNKWGKWDDEYCAKRGKGYICEFKIPKCDASFWHHPKISNFDDINDCP